MKKFLPYMLLAFLAMPGLAMAAPSLLSPLNGNSWTLYVFGNGDAIFHILQSIKLLMLPESGETGFNSLLMFLATVGFLVLAIQAGFDPSKNLMRMFTYIMVVAAVHMMTMSVTANIRIKDAVTNYDNVVPGVPALVGVPAALVSEVGHWFTKTVETYYNIPSEMTVSGGAFNLFGRLMQESNEYVISNPELKKSLSAYVADCVVPAMATGKLQASDLMTSPDMTVTLSKATHEAILTKFWPVATPNTSGTGVTYPTQISYTPTGGSATSYQVEGGLGAIIPCSAAWQELDKGMKIHADELMGASARSWSKTGVLIPFETAMSSAMAMASSGGANAFGNYSRPQGYILQQAMLNSMNGSFRTAAASIGNNDVLMAASIAQAEQSQKSSWFTAARVFTNMMGYVYTTLQAFIFAIVPVVIIALMVPGLGKSIFTNYSQILVWLMLWQPMLSIVNYLITLFGKAQIASSLELASGVTMQNKFIMTEQTNDLMLAAQFLGTSVPLLTWGLVKGSLAFTEFISHGIGSSMAQQAGATAATGNMSMNNMSMDNASMNKFNTAMSSAVGAQTTMGYTSGAQTTQDAAGNVRMEQGSAMTKTSTAGITNQQASSISESASYMEQASQQMALAKSLSENNQFGQNNSKIAAATSAALDSATKSFTSAVASKDTKSMEKAAAGGIEVANSAHTSVQAGFETAAKISSDKAILGKVASLTTGISAEAALKGSATAAAAALINEKASKTEAQKDATDVSKSKGTGEGGSNTRSQGVSAANQNGESRDRSYSKQEQLQMSAAFGSAATAAKASSESLSTTASEALMTSAAGRWTDIDEARHDVLQSNGVGGVEANAAKLRQQVGSELVNNEQLQQMTDAAKAGIETSGAQKAPGMLASHPLQTGAPSAPRAVGGNVTAEVAAGQLSTAADIKGKEPEFDANQKTMDAKFEARKDTSAIGYGLERGVENATDMGKRIGAGTKAKADAGPSPLSGRAGRE
jgi:hypothetical protein